jgi:hypothetical protein
VGERERKGWQLEGVRLTHMAVGQSCMNPRTGSECRIQRRDAWILLEALVGSRNVPSTFRRNLPIGREKKGRASQRFLLLATLQHGGSPSRRNSQDCQVIMVTSQADCLWLSTANADLSSWREEGPFVDAKMSQVQDVMGESTDALMGSRSQNTLKNERLEHQSYRQERNFIDRERLSGEMHSRVQKLGAP